MKIRGFRIEPGEIEAALSELLGVRTAVVVARDVSPCDLRLVGYVAGEGLEAESFRAALKSRLPEHMVPSAFVVLEALPLTSNGKVDRGALPAPEWSAGAALYVAPRTPAEEIVAEIWSEVLGVERMGARTTSSRWAATRSWRRRWSPVPGSV